MNSHLRNLLAPALAVLFACQGVREGDTLPQENLTESAALNAYVSAKTSTELAVLVDTDLERNRPRAAYEGLDRFMSKALVNGTAMNASLMFKEAKLETRFLHDGGQQFVGPVKELGEILDSHAEGELEGAYKALLEGGDSLAFHRYFEHDRSLFSADNIERAPFLQPHAEFFRGILAYQDVVEAPELDGARRVDLHMNRAREAFAHVGLSEQVFLSLVYSAQAWERAGRAQDAMERWLEAVETDYWPDASNDVRIAVSGRIRSYTSRLRDKVEGEVEAEWQARVSALETDYQTRFAKAHSRIATLEDALDKSNSRLADAYDQLAKALQDKQEHNGTPQTSSSKPDAWTRLSRGVDIANALQAAGGSVRYVRGLKRKK